VSHWKTTVAGATPNVEIRGKSGEKSDLCFDSFFREKRETILIENWRNGSAKVFFRGKKYRAYPVLGATPKSGERVVLSCNEKADRRAVLNESRPKTLSGG